MLKILFKPAKEWHRENIGTVLESIQHSSGHYFYIGCGGAGFSPGHQFNFITWLFITWWRAAYLEYKVK